MTKIQCSKLLLIRGIVKFDDTLISDIIKKSGGEPTLQEMAMVNALVSEEYHDKLIASKEVINELNDIMERLNDSIAGLTKKVANLKNELKLYESSKYIGYIPKMEESESVRDILNHISYE